MTTKTYDEKCHELAKAFLEDHPDLNTSANVDGLAAHIQARIDDYIDYLSTIAPYR